VLTGRLRGRWSRISLIHPSQFDILSGDMLHLFGKRSDLGAILLIGRRNVDSQQAYVCLVSLSFAGGGHPLRYQKVNYRL
jgi:hypothetical protein